MHEPLDRVRVFINWIEPDDSLGAAFEPWDRLHENGITPPAAVGRPLRLLAGARVPLANILKAAQKEPGCRLQKRDGFLCHSTSRNGGRQAYGSRQSLNGANERHIEATMPKSRNPR